jgi:peptidyl-prolyl cis-trans isomerase D
MGKRLSRILTLVFIILLAVVFIVFFGPQQPGTGSGDVAEVDGQRIRRDVFEAYRKGQEQNFQEMLGSLSRDDQQAFIDDRTLESLIFRTVIASEARDLGLEVSDAELRAALRTDPQYQQQGRFDPKLVEAYAANANLSVADLLEEQRTDALLAKFQRLVASPVRVSRAAARFELARRGSERSLRYAVARSADFAAKVELAENAARELVEKEPARVQAVYDARRAEFQQPEQVRARHILFTGEAAEARAGRAVERLAGGEPFDKLARELSEDPATASLGGELGSFPRGILPRELDAALFEQLEPGKNSAPIQSERGWHVLRLEEKLAAQDRPFAEVSEQLARDLLVQERASALAREQASRVLEEARRTGDLEAAAKRESLTVSSTGRFKRNDSAVPDLGSLDGLLEAAFALDSAHPVAARIWEDAGQFYVVALGETHEPAPEQLDSEVASETERLTRAERDRASAAWYRARRREIESSGDLTLFPLYAQ